MEASRYLHDDGAVVEAVIIVVILFSTWAPVLFLQGFMKGTMKTQSTNSTNEVTIDKHPHFLPCGRTGPTPSRLPARGVAAGFAWCGKGSYFWIGAVGKGEAFGSICSFSQVDTERRREVVVPGSSHTRN